LTLSNGLAPRSEIVDENVRIACYILALSGRLGCSGKKATADTLNG
jgi:hypothetical protein